MMNIWGSEFILIPKAKILLAKALYFWFWLLILLPAGLWAQESRLLFLPAEPNFEHLIGDPREAQSYLSAQLDKAQFDGSIAAIIEFLQWKPGDNTRWGWGIETDSFIQLESPGYGPYSLETLDYFLIFPERVSDLYLGTYLSESSGDLSNRLEFLHDSSQLGDGFFGKEQGIIYTRSSLRFTSSFQPSDRFRLYAGTGYYIQNLYGQPSFFFHLGTELYTASFGAPFGTMGRGYFTYDLQANQDVIGVLNQNFELGFQWKWKKDTHQAIRFALVYYNGNSPYGQFYFQKDDHWAFSLYFDP